MTEIFRDPFGSISHLAAEVHSLFGGSVEVEHSLNGGAAFGMPEIQVPDLTVPFGKITDVSIKAHYGSSYATLVNGAPSDFDLEFSGSFQFGQVKSPIEVTAEFVLNANPSAEHEIVMNFSLMTTIATGMMAIQPQASVGLNLEVAPNKILSGGGSFGYGHRGRLSDLGFPGAERLQEALDVNIEAEWMVTFGFSVNHEGHLDISVDLKVTGEGFLTVSGSGIEEYLRVGGHAMVGTTLFDGVPDLEWNIDIKVQQVSEKNGKVLRSIEWEISYAGEVRVSIREFLNHIGEGINEAIEAPGRAVDDFVRDTYRYDPLESSDFDRGLLYRLMQAFGMRPSNYNWR